MRTENLFQWVSQCWQIERPLTGFFNPKSGRVVWRRLSDIVGHCRTLSLLFPTSCGAIFDFLATDDPAILLKKRCDFAHFILDERDRLFVTGDEEPGLCNW
jgi:hypothetical protein